MDVKPFFDLLSTYYFYIVLVVEILISNTWFYCCVLKDGSKFQPIERGKIAYCRASAQTEAVRHFMLPFSWS
jgi:hypothetical protein